VKGLPPTDAEGCTPGKAYIGPPLAGEPFNGNTAGDGDRYPVFSILCQVSNIDLSFVLRDLIGRGGVMCGAYGFSIHDAKEVYDRFAVVNHLDDLQPRFNLRPGQMNPVVTRHSPNHMSRMF
jgi:hypothetical protein